MIHSYLLLLVLILAGQLQAQSARYYVLISESKLALWCRVNSDFSSFMLSSKLDGKSAIKSLKFIKSDYLRVEVKL